MSISPPKKPPPPDADPTNEPPTPGPRPPEPCCGGSVAMGSGDCDHDSDVVGVRPKASPPPQDPPSGPPGALHCWTLAVPSGSVMGPWPQQASPPPCGGPDGSGSVPGDELGAAALAVSVEGVVVSMGAAMSVVGCCSGLGHSKRLRQAPVIDTVGEGSSEEEEVGTGYNSEDEYEAAAARIEAMDPATVEEQELWFEKALLEKKGFIIKQMKEDGACLFRAVADQVYGDQEMHEVVRKHCMDYLMKNADYFSNYVTEDFTTYINRKRKNDCHGNHIEMQAMAEMYNRPVEVYQYNTEPINTLHGIYQNEEEPIRVSYHQNIHYNSVVNPNKATIGVGLGLPSFKTGFANHSLMKNAIKTAEESWIEQQMLGDKKQAADWEATNAAIEEQVARESYLQWLRDQEKQSRQVPGLSQLRKASATCSSATEAATSDLDEWTSQSAIQQSAASSPEHPELHADLGIKPLSPGTVLALAKPPSPCALGLNDWDDDEILASVLAVSEQEYLESMKKNKVL
ncbi:OTU domain-containing protein 5-like [Nycticebus coucang]|uniref:OTU domain-containing protein 5-like n=1 Tax=Nycticebus coucang TaxID=9470 RepID=UPI00234CADED|nr:OTU domain-containing protein 5-like [Nycticebus coucang]